MNRVETSPLKIQIEFFQSLKNAIPSHASLVEEVAQILDLSMDSAYRRIRGEKLLNIKELRALSHKYNLSLDKVLIINSNSLLFQGTFNANRVDELMCWMEDVLAQFNLFNGFKRKHVYFLVKDMPPFHHYYHPLLAGFKFFFWMKSILHYETLKNETFSFEKNYFQPFQEVTQKIIRAYNKVPSSEIWNEEGINTTLRQIEAYHAMGVISSSEITLQLYACVLEAIDHMEKMAEHGKKFSPGQSPTSDSADYRLYLNEIVLGDNTFMAEIGDSRITYLNHSVLYFVRSMDQKFNESMFHNLENLLKKSTLISKIGEKERKQFFNTLRKKVQEKIALI